MFLVIHTLFIIAINSGTSFFIYESMRGYIHQTDRRLFTPDNGIMIEVQE